MELTRTTPEQYEKLKQLGFPINTTSKNPTPTIAFVFMWFRKEKNLHIIIGGGWTSYNPFWSFAIGDIKESSIIGIKENLEYKFKSYEEAESSGLDFALEYLLKQK